MRRRPGCPRPGAAAAPAADEAGALLRYARSIQSQRGDYNGRVLSIRADDMRALAIIYDTSPPASTSG